MQITKKDIKIIIGVLIVFSLISIAGFLAIGGAILIIDIILLIGLMLLCQIEIYRRIINVTRRQLGNDWRQLEAFFSIFSLIKPVLPLPNTRELAASPDILKKLLEVIYQKKPELVVEAGSGVSTLMIAYFLKHVGKGKVISLEHDKRYSTANQELISQHGLEDIATVVYTPLVEFEIRSRKWLWYDINNLNFDESIDLLFIDGPPDKIQNLARYPAVPLLWKHLKDDSIIILDDGLRESEKNIVDLWEKEFNCITHDFLYFEKGAFLIKIRGKQDNNT